MMFSRNLSRPWSLVLAASFCALLLPRLASAANVYLQHNLVSDTPGLADHTDPNLVNAWGIAATATSPFWVSDNHAGVSTLYNSAGTPNALVVTVPASPSSGSGAIGSPTGIVASSSGFEIAPGRASSFIFATEDGTISGWNPNVNRTLATIRIDNSQANVIYKGLAIAGTPSGPRLYATNFHGGTVDVWDAGWASVFTPGAFIDPMIPSGFAPFNIQHFGDKLYVTYARQDDDKEDDVKGNGNGYVDVYDLNGSLVQRLISGGPLNSPWGLAIAPGNFGDFSKDLLVGNFGDGKINVFDPSTGAFLGALQDPSGNPIVIPGLWGLQVGNGVNGGDVNAVYFSAGPGEEEHGLFGSIQAAPVITSGGVVNSGSFQDVIAPNTWISIFGANLAATTRGWQTQDFVGGKLPTSLGGVSVTINNKPAYVGFVSPKQLNVLTPLDSTAGPVEVKITNNGLVGGVVMVSLQQLAPAFLVFDKYIAATHSDNVSIVGPSTLFPNASTPAQPGETIVLYGTGFGPAIPAIPDGELVTTALNLPAMPTITFGNTPAQVSFAGLTGAGVYQFNVTVPGSTPDGDTMVVASIDGLNTQANVFITVKRPSP